MRIVGSNGSSAVDDFVKSVVEEHFKFNDVNIFRLRPVIQDILMMLRAEGFEFTDPAQYDLVVSYYFAGCRFRLSISYDYVTDLIVVHDYDIEKL